MRALAISDTHFGAWTGRDLLREEPSLERLAPHLEEIDELIILGDLFDFLFGSVEDAFDAADGLFSLIAEKLPGKRLVFLAGNHDHHLVYREAEDRLERQIARGHSPGEGGEVAASTYFLDFLQRRLPGVEVEIAYPTYTFAGVLLTHGHFLDPHARLSGGRGSRLLTRTLWSIAAGGPEDPKTVEDYESVITLLTEWLYIAAQMPHGTQAQQNVQRAVQRAGRVATVASLPVRGARRAAGAVRGGPGGAAGREEEIAGADLESERRNEGERRRQTEQRLGAAAGGLSSAGGAGRVLSASDPTGHALAAFSKVVENLGWADDTDQIVFAHTHQPLAGVRCSRAGDRTRYWNTGSWIYEPDLSSPAAYARYLRHGWPGTAILIDSDQPEPRLIEMLADLNPLVSSGGGV